MPITVSGLVVSRNEGELLPECLGSLRQICDELVVVDLESSDSTVAVAKNAGARVIDHHPVDYVEAIRQWSINQCQGQWVVMLDPDERLQPLLIAELKKVIQKGDYVGVNIPRQNIFFGQWIKHTNFWPDRQLRCFQRTKINWPDRIHSVSVSVDGQVLALPAESSLAIKHYGYQSWGQFLRRQQRYSRVEARNRYRSGERFSVIQLGWRPLRELLVRLIKHQGYRDGLNGFFLVGALIWYQLMTELRLLKR